MHILFITGGLLIGVPILLHLIMRQEPKKLPFPAFRFLKMKRRINQRKMRLRHLLLLLLRMALIALIAWVLFQPRWGSDYFNIKGEQPVACVIIIDTSPSMGYVLSVDRGALPPGRKRGPEMLEETSSSDRERPWTALDEARFRALELIDELPPASKVAVIDSSDREAIWALTLQEARKKIRDIRRPRAASRPLTQVLPLAYQLFARVGEETVPGQENMPRLLAIFSDRTAPSWEAEQSSFLTDMRKELLKEAEAKAPFIATFLDVGVDKPLNLAITSIDMKPQLVPANKPVEFSAWLEATGTVQENTIEVFVDGKGTPALSQAVRVEPGTPKEVTFRLEGLPPGLHQCEIALKTADALPTDDIRYLTFRIREPRRVLLVADANPVLGSIAGSLGMVGRMIDTTALWRIALESTGWYECEIKSARDFLELKPAQSGQFEAIVFTGLIGPTGDVWDKATAYVEGGGKLVVAPGGEELLQNESTRPPAGYDNKLLPGTVKKWVDLDRTRPGVSWTWDALKAHPLLNDFREWTKNPRIDFIANRPQVWGYWEVEPRDKPSVVVSYADDADADKRRPAVLERQIGATGKVLLFTTPLDGRFEIGSGAKAKVRFNNDYAGSSFFLVLSNLTVRYLTGEMEDATYNFISGQNVFIKWPIDASDRSKFYFLSGPDLSDKEAEVIRPLNEAILRLGPDRLRSAGNYDVRSDPADKKREFKPWREGFSLNAPVDESNLERVPIPEIEAILGEKTVVASDRERKLQDILGGKFGAPIELFPFLMILLLLFMAFENLLSNKFYKQQPPAERGA